MKLMWSRDGIFGRECGQLMGDNVVYVWIKNETATGKAQSPVCPSFY